MPGFAVWIASAVVLMTALGAGKASAALRVAVPGSHSTVEVPDGWTVAPASSDPPSLLLWHCEPPQHDACTQQAEMQVQQLQGTWRPASLDEVVGVNSQAVVASSPSASSRRIQLAGHDAVESSGVSETIVDFVSGGSATSRQAHVSITVQIGSAFFRCAASSFKVSTASSLRDPLLKLCSSLQFAEAAMPARTP